MSETKFVSGLFIQPKNDKTPDFIKLKLSFKSKEFVQFLKENNNEAGYVNIDLKKSKEGKLYFTLNDWKKGDDQTHKQDEDINPDDVPF